MDKDGSRRQLVGGLAAWPQNANIRLSRDSGGKTGQESPGAGDQGETSWRGKPEAIRLAAPISIPAGADFWAVQVWRRWGRSSAAPCRSCAKAQAFLRPTRRRRL